MPALNPWAILSATVSGFIIGGLWYSPLLFARSWMRAAGLTEAELEKGNKAKIFGLSFVLILIAAMNLAMFLGQDASVGWGLAAGALAALWVACALGVLYLFEQRPLALFLVNAGYWVVTLATMGAILALW
jgi:hypothetical protein